MPPRRGARPEGRGDARRHAKRLQRHLKHARLERRVERSPWTAAEIRRMQDDGPDNGLDDDMEAA